MTTEELAQEIRAALENAPSTTVVAAWPEGSLTSDGFSFLGAEGRWWPPAKAVSAQAQWTWYRRHTGRCGRHRGAGRV